MADRSEVAVLDLLRKAGGALAYKELKRRLDPSVRLRRVLGDLQAKGFVTMFPGPKERPPQVWEDVENSNGEAWVTDAGMAYLAELRGGFNR